MRERKRKLNLVGCDIGVAAALRLKRWAEGSVACPKGGSCDTESAHGDLLFWWIEFEYVSSKLLHWVEVQASVAASSLLVCLGYRRQLKVWLTRACATCQSI